MIIIVPETVLYGFIVLAFLVGVVLGCGIGRGWKR